MAIITGFHPVDRSSILLRRSITCISKIMITKHKVDPWSCMSMLGTVEFLKLSSFGKQADSKTVGGYQPIMDNPIMWEQFDNLYTKIKQVLDQQLDFKWQIHRSWVVSYNKDGWQDSHTHQDSVKSCVVCLLGHGDGTLEFETGETVNMYQGDMVLFDSTIRHWAHKTKLPKTILSFDISQVG